MKEALRFGLGALCGLVMAAADIVTVQAGEAYPSRPITMIVPFVPGGPTDLLARLTAEAIRTELGATVVVDNKPGAGGSVAGRIALAAKPDGYTLIFGTGGTQALNGLLYPNLGYDPITDFVPIAAVASSPNLVVVNAALPVKTIGELVAYGKANPGKLSYGSGGYGTSTHLAAELFAHEAGIDIKHVPYKGTSPALIDLASGNIDLVFDSIGTALPFATGEKVRPIAISGPKRNRLRPDLPTIAESGFPGFDVQVYYGLFAPVGTPQPIIDRLNKAVNAYMATPGMQKRYDTLGLDPLLNSPQFLGDLMKAEKARWAPIVQSANIRIN